MSVIKDIDITNIRYYFLKVSEDGYRPEVPHSGNRCGKIAKKNRITIGE
jgi:hypothetical protein